MAPFTHAAAPPEPEVRKTNPVSTLVLDSPKAKAVPRTVPTLPPIPDNIDLFKDSLIENNKIKNISRTVDLLVAITVHILVISIPILAGLYFTDNLNLKEFQSTFLVAPPPPPAPPPAAPTVAVRAAAPHRVFQEAGKLIAPRAIPKNIAQIKEAPEEPDLGGGVAGGVPGGVAGGSMGGVLGGVIGGIKSTTIAAPLAPKENRPKAPVRVGGRVREPKLIERVEPVYPALAKQTHMQGIVVIEAILDEHGNVVEAKVTSGPPLLIQSALDAVRKWRYEPTYLNDQPVQVQLNVTVTFRLSQ